MLRFMHIKLHQCNTVLHYVHIPAHPLVQHFVTRFIQTDILTDTIAECLKRASNLTKWSIIRDNVQNSDKMINHQVLVASKAFNLWEQIHLTTEWSKEPGHKMRAKA